MRTPVPIIVGLLLVLGACGGGDGGAGTLDGAAALDTTLAPDTTLASDTTLAPVTTIAGGTTGVTGDELEESEPGDEGADHHDGPGEGGGHMDEGDAPGDAVHGARVIDVSMTDFAFEPAIVSVTAGETVTFRISNDGLIVHEFRLSNAHRIEEHLAEGHADHGDDGHHGDADVVLELEAGEHGELTVTFPEDTTFFTEVACLIPGHYEAGMKGAIDYG